jgi:hypothetical protein
MSSVRDGTTKRMRMYYRLLLPCAIPAGERAIVELSHHIGYAALRFFTSRQCGITRLSGRFVVMAAFKGAGDADRWGTAALGTFRT